MTVQTLLRESVKGAPVKAGENRWRVIVARPGVGSSGTYSAEVFKRDALKMIPPGAQSFFNHDDKRDPRDMLGYFPEGAIWSEEDQAVVAELSVFDNWKPLVEQLAPHCGISLYAMGEKDEDGNVTAFIEDAYNGADLVSRPGLSGAGFDQKLYEAAIAVSDKPSAETSAQGKEYEMDEKVLEALDALSTKFDAFVSANTAKVEENDQPTVEDAVKEAVAKTLASVNAIEAARADLLPSQVENLLAEAAEGKDMAPLIEQAKKVATEAIAHVTESASTGRIVEGAKTTYGAYR